MKVILFHFNFFSLTGDFARALSKTEEDSERKQSARESKSSQIEDAEPAPTNEPAFTPVEAPVYTPVETPVYTPVEAPIETPVEAPVAPVAAAAAVLPQVAAAARQPFFNQFLTNPYLGLTQQQQQQQQFFYRFG